MSHGVDTHGSGSGYQPYAPTEGHRERKDTKTSNASSAGETTATVRFRIRRSGKVTFTRPVGNHYVVVENRGNVEIDISRWRIEEIVNENRRGQFVFPEGTTLLPKKEVKIFGRSFERDAALEPGSHVFRAIEQYSLGNGAQCVLVNNRGEQVSWQLIENCSHPKQF